jgi:hypothetical protein
MNAKFRSFLIDHQASLVILLIGFSISIFISLSAQEKEDLKIKSEFSNSVQTYYSSMNESFTKNILLVRSLQSYFSNSQSINPESFKTYTRLLLNYYPGVQALSWVPKVPHAQIKEFAKQAQQKNPKFYVKERTQDGKDAAVSEREFYFPVYYVEPLLGNEPAIGFDLYSNPQRAQSIVRSIESNNIAVSSRIRLIQEKGSQFGILIIAPVFDSSSAATGVVTGVFRLGDVINNAVHELNTLGLDFTVYEGNQNSLDTNLFSRRTGYPDQSMKDSLDYFNQDFKLVEYRQFQIGDKVWEVKFTPAHDAYKNNKTFFSWLLLFSGFLLTITIAWVNRSQQINEFLNKKFKETTALNQEKEELTFKVLHSEKLVALGQLAAGVAHEINNPIAFVASNITTLKEYFQAFEAVLNKYIQIHESMQLEVQRLEQKLDQQTGDQPTNSNPANQPLEKSLTLYSVDQMNEFKKKLNFEFLIEDCHAMMTETQEGIQRVKTIIQDLKDFARADASNKWQVSNLHKSLKSTLNILSSELKYKAEVKLKLGNIPEIECIPSQINQVFMNLIINASQAMEKGKIGIITIRSGVIESNSSMTLNDLPERVWFEVEDNGAGISATNLTKIFDPFFTTKEVGLGTGLGLSVSHGIILKHKGELTVKSELGSGTVFRIVLPVFQLN